MNGDPTGEEMVARFERVPLRSLSGGTDKLDLQLRRGGFYMLVSDDEIAGRSLLDMLTLRARPSGGTFHLFGQKANRPRPRLVATLRRRMGLVQDRLPLLPHLSIFDNVALPLRVAGVEERDLRAPVSEMLTSLALGFLAYGEIADLSVEDRCCVAMARAMIGRPDLLLLENIFDRVSPACAWRLIQRAESLRRDGATIIAATRDDRTLPGIGGLELIRVGRQGARTPLWRSLW